MGDNKFSVLVTDKTYVIYDEILHHVSLLALFTHCDGLCDFTKAFELDALAANSVDMQSVEIPARSGIFTVKIQTLKGQQISILCAGSTQCIDSNYVCTFTCLVV